MRSKFLGHFPLEKAKIDDLWQTATIVFDTNVLLNLYRYSDDAREEFLALLNSVKRRCWLPEQCASEFLKNRIAVIQSQISAYDATAKSIRSIRDSFAGSKGHPFISGGNFENLSQVIAKIETDLATSRSKFEERISRDDIAEEVSNIFEGIVGDGFADAELNQMFTVGADRYREKTPPGYKDGSKYEDPATVAEKKSKFGDWLLWKQLMDMAGSEKKSVILVTDDRKEDWWLEASGKTVGPRPELVSEFLHTTGQNILIYTPNRFLEASKAQLTTTVSDKTIQEIRAEHDSRKNELAEFVENRSRIDYMNEPTALRDEKRLVRRMQPYGTKDLVRRGSLHRKLEMDIVSELHSEKKSFLIQLARLDGTIASLNETLGTESLENSFNSGLAQQLEAAEAARDEVQWNLSRINKKIRRLDGY